MGLCKCPEVSDGGLTGNVLCITESCTQNEQSPGLSTKLLKSALGVLHRIRCPGCPWCDSHCLSGQGGAIINLSGAPRPRNSHAECHTALSSPPSTGCSPEPSGASSTCWELQTFLEQGCFNCVVLNGLLSPPDSCIEALVLSVMESEQSL